MKRRQWEERRGARKRDYESKQEALGRTNRLLSFHRNLSIWYYRMFSTQADWTLTHTRHKDTEHSTIEASITLDVVTMTDLLIRWSPNEWPSVCREIPVSAGKSFWTPAKWTSYRTGKRSFVCMRNEANTTIHSETLQCWYYWLSYKWRHRWYDLSWHDLRMTLFEDCFGYSGNIKVIKR
jgi:hypothetical protein